MGKLATISLLLGLSVGLVAQKPQLYVGPTTNENIRWATKGDFDGSILFCRGYYTANRAEPNGDGWWTDYPGADHNFLVRLSELSLVRVRFDENRIPFYVTVKLDDPLLFKCPVLFMEDVGTMQLAQSEVEGLAKYLTSGGFLWVDDFWGNEAWDQWMDELRRVLPSGLYPLIDVPKDHPIMTTLYKVDHIPQQPAIGLWNVDPDWPTSERGEESKDVHFRGVIDERDRLIVVMTHNTDIADGWEEEKPENQAYIQAFSATSYAIGINIFIYALTH